MLIAWAASRACITSQRLVFKSSTPCTALMQWRCKKRSSRSDSCHVLLRLQSSMRPRGDCMIAECTQVREQAKAFLQKSEDHVQGLNLINSTNLDYFQPQHQSEMINLKAQFCAALGDGDAGSCLCIRQADGMCVSSLPRIPSTINHLPLALSNAAHGLFSESLTLWPLCWEAWMAWGKFCDGMYEKSKEGQWLEFLATCYLQVRNLL